VSGGEVCTVNGGFLPSGSWRCGYVTFPDGTDVPGEDDSGAPVNGGITYQQDYKVGWDYAHGFNHTTDSRMPSDEKVVEEAKELIKWVREEFKSSKNEVVS
jgi:hypothetical protein